MSTVLVNLEDKFQQDIKFHQEVAEFISHRPWYSYIQAERIGLSSRSVGLAFCSICSDWHGEHEVCSEFNKGL